MNIMILFSVVLMTIMAIVHTGVWIRVIRRLDIGYRLARGLRVFVVLNYICVSGYLASKFFLGMPSELFFVFSLSLGVGFLFFISTILYELIHIIQTHIPFDDTKRKFIKQSTDMGVVALGGIYLGGAIYGGQKEPTIVDINLAQNLFDKPYKIAQISDMHIGGLIDEKFVKKSVHSINELDVDVVAITGDLTDAPVAYIKESLSHLSNLKSRLGVYFIVGNHEYFHGIENTIKYLKSIGIVVLENSSVEIGDTDNRFNIAGLYDYTGYRNGKFVPNVKKTKNSLTANIPTMLLMHQPKQIDKLGSLKPNLMLSGHTHGGQIYPFSYLVKLDQPYLKGLHKLSSKQAIYINSGIGFWGPQMRLGSLSEISLICWS